MKLKIMNQLITALAILGVFVFIGAVGNMDYMVTVGEYYPISSTIKTMIVGFILVLPAIIREEVM